MSNATTAASIDEGDDGMVSRAVAPSLPIASELDGMRAWAEALVDRARTEGVTLTGEDGLLTSMVREVLQTGLDVEMADHPCEGSTLHRPSKQPRRVSASSRRSGGPLYPAMIQSWENAWKEFVPFLEFPVELRRILYTTNAIEPLDARFRRAVRHRGHFPTSKPR
jgi:transposase-like protein